MPISKPMTRRQATMALAAAAAGLGCSPEGCTPKAGSSAHPDNDHEAAGSTRMPTAFIPHGGGPWPILSLPMMPADETKALAAYMRSIAAVPKQEPRALLVLSAHWEREKVTVNTGAKPDLYFDYSGFPPESYQLKWPAPGDPELAGEVEDLIRSAGLPTARDSDRGFDHGTFIPLLLAYPKAEVPVVQVSLKRGLDPDEHLALGRALAPLRDRGVYILGSGNSFHNLRALIGGDRSFEGAAAAFDAWLEQAVTASPTERASQLTDWGKAPAARRSHPREEHLIPLMVVAGAAGEDAGRVVWRGTMAGMKLSAHHFG